MATAKDFLVWFDKVFGDPNHPQIIKRKFIAINEKVEALEVENATLKKKIEKLRARAVQKGLMSHGSFTGKH